MPESKGTGFQFLIDVPIGTPYKLRLFLTTLFCLFQKPSLPLSATSMLDEPPRTCQMPSAACLNFIKARLAPPTSCHHSSSNNNRSSHTEGRLHIRLCFKTPTHRLYRPLWPKPAELCPNNTSAYPVTRPIQSASPHTSNLPARQ